MTLGPRTGGNQHKLGVRSEDWWQFAPGQKVVVVEGYVGTVTAVEDGPVPGDEHYIVELDDGMGGGEYSSNELTAVDDPEVAESLRATARMASEDYPVLAEILADRPPLAVEEPTGTTSAALHEAGYQVVDDGGQIWAGPFANHYQADDAKDELEADPSSANYTLYVERSDDTSTIMFDEGFAFGEPEVEMRTEGTIHTALAEGERVKVSFIDGTVRTVVSAVEDANGAQFLIDTLGNRLPIESARTYEVITPGERTAGWVADQIDQFAENVGHVPGRAFSVSWCRFRRDQHCWYPETLDAESSAQAGYAVWFPQDRGHCPRYSFEAQRDCPLSKPGPHSGHPGAMPDATFSWQEGGQRPGGRWIASLETETPVEIRPKAAALEVAFTERGTEGNHTHITMEEVGTIPTAVIRYMPGKMDERPGEHRNKKGAQWEEFKADIAANGIQHGIFITLDWNDKPYIAEGNHRRDAAVELGLDEVPVQIRYFGHAERQGTLMERHQAKVDRIYANDPELAKARAGQSFISSIHPTAAFEFTATWADVREKAKRIRSAGGVNLVRSASGYASAEVQGDHGTYRADIMRMPGKQAISVWSCTCDWGINTHWMVGAMARYAGRLCSHALALNYEVQSRGMFGAEVQADDRPSPFWDRTASKADGKLYHITDKADFRLDPTRHPENNTTLGGDWPEPGIFLGGNPEHWLNGYGYWRPFVVEFQVPSGVGKDFGSETFVPATDFDKITLTRVLPLDGYCREEYSELGWTEDALGTDFLTGEPIDTTWKPNRFPGYRSPDARTLGSSWQQEYKQRVEKFRKGRTGSIHRVASWLAHIVMRAEIDPADPDAGLRAVEEMCEKGDHTHSGLVIKSVDSGRVLLTQRTPYAEDPEGVYGRWEFPGGGMGDDETPLDSAMREFNEETGLSLPEGARVVGCYETGPYLGIVVVVPNEAWTVNANLLDFEVMGIGWFDIDAVDGSDLARKEMESSDWDMIREASKTPKLLDYCAECGARIQRNGTAAPWRHQRPQPSGAPHDHSAKPGGTKTAMPKRVQPGEYAFSDGSRLLAVFDGDLRQTREWQIIGPDGVWWNTYPSKWEAVLAWEEVTGKKASLATEAMAVQPSAAAAARFKEETGMEPWEAAGLLQVTIPRSQRGTVIGLYNAAEAGMEDSGYATVCEFHSTLIIHPTLALARGHATDPKGWCEACREGWGRPNDEGDPYDEMGNWDESRRYLASRGRAHRTVAYFYPGLPMISRPIWTDASLAFAPSESIKVPVAKHADFAAKVQGSEVIVTGLEGADVVLADGSRVPAAEVVYPDWHPTRGLDFVGALATPTITHKIVREDDGWGEEDSEYDAHHFELDGAKLVVHPSPEGVMVIDSVSVPQDARRQGLATQLFEEAQRVLGPLQHSEWMTADGAAWAESVGGERHGDPAHWKTGALATYELLVSMGGEYAHVATPDPTDDRAIALCGSTINVAESRTVSAMDALGQATCGRCVAALRLSMDEEPLVALAGLDVSYMSRKDIPLSGEGEGVWIAMAIGESGSYENAGYIRYHLEMGEDSYDDKIVIDMLEVYPAFQRKGIGTGLLDSLQANWRGRTIDPGKFTPEGAALWKARTGEDVAGTEHSVPLARTATEGEMDLSFLESDAVFETMAAEPEEIEPEAMLKDEPEPALPSTDGAKEGELVGPSWLSPTAANLNPRERALADNREIAQMAERFLKEGVKAFSPAEQEAIISEGENDGTIAGNLDLLTLDGTHYGTDDDDDWMI